MENFCFINAIHCTRKSTSRKTNCVYNVLVRVDGTRVVFEGNRVGFYEDKIIKTEIITAEVEKEVINFLMRLARLNKFNETMFASHVIYELGARNMVFDEINVTYFK